MSRFTSEDLMKAMGLQVGDRVKITMEFYGGRIKTGIYEIDKYTHLKCLPNQTKDDLTEIGGMGIVILLRENVDYEILPRPKRVGDLKCDTIGGCDHCPLSILVGCYAIELDTLYSNLKQLCDIHNDQEIYNLLKARLDKEVE